MDGAPKAKGPKQPKKLKARGGNRGGGKSWRTAEEIEAELKANESEDSSQEESTEERDPDDDFFGGSASDEEEEEESSEEEVVEKKKKGVEGVIETTNLNRNSNANKLVKAETVDMSKVKEQKLSRREREEVEKAKAKKTIFGRICTR
eukprot:TRINITY_DN1313_c0_g1_i1.p1 TRINITY_DN1313_c0_g1~~TRINITY_DN1313_c0_g1_i1.p1  ORF type:complete len:162 (-),score=50.78 TRINITY_DN1313_c0_g1_i1:213-656(-)